MSNANETFFTVVGCMDGRVQSVMEKYGKSYFSAKYPDTITDPGIVGTISKGPSKEFSDDLKKKLLISLDLHHSVGILVNGHAECAGNPVDDTVHKEDIKKSVEFIKKLTNSKVPVIGLFVERAWAALEVDKA